MSQGDQDAGYKWETEYEKTWEVLQENDEGHLQSVIDSFSYSARLSRIQTDRGQVRLGMMRHLMVVVDMSAAMSDQDLRPSRIAVTLKLLEDFMGEYFDQNPISHLGIIITQNKRAEKIHDLSGNSKRLSSTLQKLSERPTLGEPSLQNALDLAARSLRNMPPHSSREVLVIMGSLTTCDPGDINTTIKALKDLNVRCSAIGLAAEVRVCKKLCHSTEGTYSVILDESHFKQLLSAHVIPLPATIETESSLIRMGFPQHSIDADKKPSLCMCHLDSKSKGLDTDGYICPQCKSKYCELPVECVICGLTLVSPPHLARSYHHLFPLKNFTQVQVEATSQRICYGCQFHSNDANMWVCESCHEMYCMDCNEYIHTNLHVCPGCSNTSSTRISLS